MVVVTAVLVAVVQAVQQGDVATALTLSSMALCSIVCPLADAAVCRRSEHAADRYAAACGFGPQLSSALRSTHSGASSRKVNWTRRMLSRHPSVDRRLEELDTTVIRPDARPPELWGSASAWHDTATAARDIHSPGPAQLGARTHRSSTPAPVNDALDDATWMPREGPRE